MTNVLVLGATLPLLFAFGESFIVHVRDRRRLTRILHELGIPRGAVVVTAMEGAVVALLIMDSRSAGMAAGVFIAAATALVMWRSRTRALSDCGCGRVPKPVSRSFYVRNIVLGLAALVLVFTA